MMAFSDHDGKRLLCTTNLSRFDNKKAQEWTRWSGLDTAVGYKRKRRREKERIEGEMGGERGSESEGEQGNKQSVDKKLFHLWKVK